MAQPPLRPQDAVMLIPSLEPDDRLPAYVRRLLDKGFQHVVIVDDGSSAAYQPIFAELDAMDGVSVTHHELNRGKGCALKTGYAYIQAHFPAASGVITADADGQHTVEDCWHLAEVLTEASAPCTWAAATSTSTTFRQNRATATKSRARFSACSTACICRTRRQACAPSAWRICRSCWMCRASALSTRCRC